MKAYTLQRLVAYILDIFIISFALSIFGMFLPESNKLQEINDYSDEVFEQYKNSEIDSKEYFIKGYEISYDKIRERYLINVLEIVLIILYFVCYQLYANGQTLGKRIMKIKIEKNDGSKLEMNDLLKRSLILNSLYYSIIGLVLVLTVSKSVFVPIIVVADILTMVIGVVLLIMILFRKDGRGLHDLFAHTKVVVVEEAVVEKVPYVEVVETVPNVPVEEETEEQEEEVTDEKEKVKKSERTNRTRSSKKRQSKGDKQDM